MSRSPDSPVFPPAKWTVLLVAVILFEFLTHSNFDSPYLYYTQGNFELVNRTFGAHLGPPGTILHYDTVNYWTIQGLFSGKYGSSLMCTSRPLYPFLASLLDNYVDKVYVGWFLNLGFWLLGCLFGYAWVVKMSGDRNAGLLFSFLVAMTPGYINMVWQPMGYVAGYSLLVIYLCYLAHAERYEADRWGSIGGHVFLLSACSFTYDILGPICLVLFISQCRKHMRKADLLLVVLIVVLITSLWTNVVVANLLQVKGLGVSRQVAHLAQGHSRAILPNVLLVLRRIGFGILLCCFFLPSVLAGVFFLFLPPKAKALTLWVGAAVALPLFYMGIVAEIISPTRSYSFYHFGRIVTYFFPAVYLALSIGLVSCPIFSRDRPVAQRLSIALLLGIYFVVANMDVLGFRGLYHLFNFRNV